MALTNHTHPASRLGVNGVETIPLPRLHGTLRRDLYLYLVLQIYATGKQDFLYCVGNSRRAFYCEQKLPCLSLESHGRPFSVLT